MEQIIDHLDRHLEVPRLPSRIISLSPAFTATLFELSLENEIVGRTRFCNTPKERVKRIQNVGGTKDIELDRVRALAPDLIIAEKEENTKDIVEMLEKEFPVFVFEVQSVADSYRMIKDLGRLTNRRVAAETLINQAQMAFENLPDLQDQRVAYVIWQAPFMVVGKNTYIDSLLTTMGFINPFSNLESRYPAVTLEALQDADLDYLLLATEPFPFREKHVAHFSAQFSQTKVINIDGEMLWYGSNMIPAGTYLKQLFTKDVIK